MRRTIIGLAAAAVTTIAVASTPALAGPWSTNGPGSGTCPMTGATSSVQGSPQGPGAGYGPGNGPGTGMGQGMGRGMGQGMGRGMGPGQGMAGRGLAAVPSGTLTDAQKATLASMAEEEKLAHDVYATLGTRYPDAWQFSRIVNAETMHLNAVRLLMTRYGISDPTAGKAVGTFTSARFQDLYDGLVAAAPTTDKALAAGVSVERADIGDLTSALSGLSAPDVTQVYTNLRTASQRHLAAFGG